MDAQGHTLWVRLQHSDSDKVGSHDVETSDGRVYLTTIINAETDLDVQRSYPNNADHARKFPTAFCSNLSCWDGDGVLQWHRELSIKWDGGVNAYSVARRKDGGVLVAGRMIGDDFYFEQRTIPRSPPGGRDGFVLAVDDQGELIRHWFYTDSDKVSRIVPWMVATNSAGKVAVGGWFIGPVRAPTGHMLLQPGPDWFLTIMDGH